MSSASNNLSLIHPVRKASQSWFSVIVLLEKGSLSLGIGTFVWSLVTCGKIRCTWLWWISRWAVCVHGGGRRARTFNVNPSCRVKPGILLIWDRRWGMGLAVSSDNISPHGQCRTEWVGTGWKRYLSRRLAWITRYLVWSSNMLESGVRFQNIRKKLGTFKHILKTYPK